MILITEGSTDFAYDRFLLRPQDILESEIISKGQRSDQKVTLFFRLPEKEQRRILKQDVRGYYEMINRANPFFRMR